MNEYKIELNGYTKKGELKYSKSHFIKSDTPCNAQIELLLEKVMADDSNIIQCPIIGGYEYEIEAVNDWIYRTSNIKLVKFQDAY